MVAAEIANLEYAAQRQREERPGSQRVVLWHAHVLSHPAQNNGVFKIKLFE